MLDFGEAFDDCLDAAPDTGPFADQANAVDAQYQ
jgi:hypothetical protein